MPCEKSSTNGGLPLVCGVEQENWVWAEAGIDVEAIRRFFAMLAPLAIGRGPRLENDLFLRNSDRFYTDQLTSIEWATPECRDPRSLAISVLAAQKLLCATSKVAGMTVAGHHVDVYNAANAVHLNFSVRQLNGPFDALPHLLSSGVILWGEGGIDPMEAGIQFTLAPRALHGSRKRCGSWGSVSDLRQEHHSGRGFRLHSTCGVGAPQSHVAIYLRCVATTLVVGHADFSPACFAFTKALGDAHLALEIFANDPTLTSTHGERTAAEIQWMYVQACRAAIRQSGPVVDGEEGFLAYWEESLCWAAAKPRALSTTLDWAMKERAFAELASQLLLPWPIPTRVNKAANLLWRQFSGSVVAPDVRFTPECAHRLLESDVNARSAATRLLLSLDEFDLLMEVLRCRPEFFEIDMRFGLSDGIFYSLDRKGLLTHTAPGIDSDLIDQAMSDPPPGRAAQRVAACPSGCANATVDWSRVWIADENGGQVIELPDPAGVEEPIRRSLTLAEGRTILLSTAIREFRSGRYESARRIFARIAPGTNDRFCAWAMARCGKLDEALRLLSRHYANQAESLASLTDEMNVHVFSALLSPELTSFENLVRRGSRLVQQSPGETYFAPLVPEYRAHAYVRQRPRAALSAANRAHRIESAGSNEPRVMGRILAVRARARMMLGIDGALSDLTAAESLQRESGQLGDLVSLSLPLYAYLAPSHAIAEDKLFDALALAAGENLLGEVRAVLLLALIVSDDSTQTFDRVRALVERIDTARNCRHVQEILGSWKPWVRQNGGFPVRPSVGI